MRIVMAALPILVTRASDLMAAHGPRLWETGLKPKSGYLDLTAHALRGNRKLENCLLI